MISFQPTHPPNVSRPQSPIRRQTTTLHSGNRSQAPHVLPSPPHLLLSHSMLVTFPPFPLRRISYASSNTVQPRMRCSSVFSYTLIGCQSCPAKQLGSYLSSIPTTSIDWSSPASPLPANFSAMSFTLIHVMQRQIFFPISLRFILNNIVQVGGLPQPELNQLELQ